MPGTVFLLGAGFSRAALDPASDLEAPLANDFFQLLIKRARFRDRHQLFQSTLSVDDLLGEVRRYWGLDLDGLESAKFDIEECLTLFESLLSDSPPPSRAGTLKSAASALRGLLMWYLSKLERDSRTSLAAEEFGRNVVANQADVITFNYDTLAEKLIARASGRGKDAEWTRADDELPSPRIVNPADYDMRTNDWSPLLAQGFKFDLVTLPTSGSPIEVAGPDFYAHPNNRLYSSRRVLKLHGSINWLRSTGMRDPRASPFRAVSPRPEGIFCMDGSNHLGQLVSRDDWSMESAVIPPLLNKNFHTHPFTSIWEGALETLSHCEELIVIGYSFPPTDFRTKRLFLEAFSSNHNLQSLTVINPDCLVADVVQRLTRFEGTIAKCRTLHEFYGVPATYHDLSYVADIANRKS